MQLNPKLLSTLSYLSSLCDPQEEIMFSFHKGKVLSANLTTLDVKPVELPSYCAFEDILDNVLSDMCTDCLKLDYHFKNPFFIDLCKAYVNSLVHTYGSEVPITRTLAIRILQYKLHPGQVWLKDGPFVIRQVVDEDDDCLLSDVGPYVKFLLRI